MQVQTGTERVAKDSVTCECKLERREKQKAVQHAGGDWNGERSKRQCNMRMQTGKEREAKGSATCECKLERREKQKAVQHASSDSERRKYAKKLNFKNSTIWNTKAINIFNKFGIPSKLFGARSNKEINAEFYAG
jgi:hypothetical protein